MSRNYAVSKFGIRSNDVEGRVSSRSPYLKYTWVARLEFEDGATGPVDYALITLKTCELPRWTIDTQVVNSYNRKTVVQTRLNFEPITMSLYDQQDDVAESFVWDYVKGQFDPISASKNASTRPLKVTIKMHAHSFGGLDDDVNMLPADDDTKEKIYVLRNAYLVDAQHDTLDYSTSDVVLWTITLRYEQIEWVGGFEGEDPVIETGIPKAPQEFSPPAENFQQPLPIEPIPDASPGLLEMEGYGSGNVDYGAVNYKPTGLAQVLDERASKEKAAKQIATPGAGSEPTYTGYESAFVPTPPGPEAKGFNASSGTAGAKTNTGADNGQRRTDSSTAEAAASYKNKEPGALGKEKPSGQIQSSSEMSSAQAKRQRNQNFRDELKAKQTNQSVEQVRAARARNIAEIDKRTPDWD